VWNLARRRTLSAIRRQKDFSPYHSPCITGRVQPPIIPTPSRKRARLCSPKGPVAELVTVRIVRVIVTKRTSEHYRRPLNITPKSHTNHAFLWSPSLALLSAPFASNLSSSSFVPYHSFCMDIDIRYSILGGSRDQITKLRLSLIPFLLQMFIVP